MKPVAIFFLSLIALLPPQAKAENDDALWLKTLAHIKNNQNWVARSVVKRPAADDASQTHVSRIRMDGFQVTTVTRK